MRRLVAFVFLVALASAPMHLATAQQRGDRGLPHFDLRDSETRVARRAETDELSPQELGKRDADVRNALPLVPPVADTREVIGETTGEPLLDLSALQGIAEQSNPTLREATAQLQAARGRWTQAGLPPNPTFGYSGQQLGSRGQAEQQGVVLGQQIITGGKLRLDQAIIAQEITRTARQLEAQRMRVLTDVAIAYFESLAAQRRIELTANLVQIGERSANSVESLLKANEASRIELLQARIEADNSRILRNNAENRANGSWRNLRAVVGDPGLPPQPLSGSLDDVPHDMDWEDALARLLGNSPELAVARANAERARWAHQRATKEWIPNLDVQGIVQHDQQIRSSDGALQITAPIPVWNRNQGAVREAFANISASEQALQRVQLNLQRRLASVFERYVTAKQQVERYNRDILPAASEQLGLVNAAFQGGEVNFLTLLTAQRTYFQTNLSALDAQRELALAASEIEGFLLTDSLGDSPASR